MKHLSESNKRSLIQSIENNKDEIPIHIAEMLQKSKHPNIHLTQNFKNLQDPLSYNKNKKIDQLKRQAFSASKSLHEEMDEISQVSKNSYRLVMTPQIGRYDFDELLYRRCNNHSSISDKQFYQKLKAKSQKFKKQQYDPDDVMQRIKKLNYPLKDLSNLLAKSNQFVHNKSFCQLNQKQKQGLKKPLSYDIIKTLNATGLQQQFEDVELYQYLRKEPIKNHTPFVSQFNITKNQQINRSRINFRPELIQKSMEFSSNSKSLFFDFERNLTFWKGLSQKQKQNKNKKQSQQEILREFNDIRMQKISVHHILKFGSRNITPWGIKSYNKLKKIHTKAKAQIDWPTQGLSEQYEKLLKEYNFLHALRKSQAKAPTTKFIHSQVQTIYTMPNQHFDEYFHDDTVVLLNKLDKLNKVRQRVLKQVKFKDKLVVVENACQQITDLLFKLLMMMLRDQKFMSSKGFAIFGYANLFHSQDKQQAQKLLLKFIHRNIDKFQIQQVDNVPKREIIKIYAEEKSKNNRILELLGKR